MNIYGKLTVKQWGLLIWKHLNLDKHYFLCVQLTWTISFPLLNTQAV